MHYRRYVACLGLAAGLVLRTPAVLGQVQQETTTTTVQNQDGATSQIHTVTTIIGSSVQLQGGDAYGKIYDIVLNDSGCLEYVVVDYQDQYYVVPWTVARVNYQQRTIVLDTTQQNLRQVAFNRNAWRGVTFNQLSQKAQQVFGSGAPGRPGRLDRGQPGRPDRDRGGVQPEGRTGPQRKERATEPPQNRDGTPKRVAPRDRPPGKDSDRPTRKDGAARPKAEDRPPATPSEPPK